MRWNTPSRSEIPIEIVGGADSIQPVVEQLQALARMSLCWTCSRTILRARVLLAGAELDGLAVIRTIKGQWPAVRVVVLTMYATDRAAVLQAGADAFLLKGCPTSELLAAVLPVRSRVPYSHPPR